MKYRKIICYMDRIPKKRCTKLQHNIKKLKAINRRPRAPCLPDLKNLPKKFTWCSSRNHGDQFMVPPYTPSYHSAVVFGETQSRVFFGRKWYRETSVSRTAARLIVVVFRVLLRTLVNNRAGPRTPQEFLQCYKML